MNCAICFNPFDHSKFKPFTLSCPHTICISCINQLVVKKCPTCNKIITIYNPNLALLDLIPESEYDLMKKETLKRLSQTIEANNELNKVKEKKLQEFLTQIKKINENISNVTSSLIDKLLTNQTKLFQESNSLETEIKKFFASLNDNQLNNEKNLIDSNAYNMEQIANLNVSLLCKQAELVNLTKEASEFKENLTFLASKSISINNPQIGEIKTNKKIYRDIIKDGIKERLNANFGKSIACFDKAINLISNDPLAFSEKGITYFNEEKYREAIECFEKSIQLSPKQSDFFYNKALCLFQMNFFENALEFFEKTIQLNSNYAASYYYKGLTLKNLKKLKDALKTVNHLIQINPCHEAFCLKGDILFDEQLPREAIIAYDKAIEMNSNNCEYLIRKAKCLMSLKEFENNENNRNVAIDLQKTKSETMIKNEMDCSKRKRDT